MVKDTHRGLLCLYSVQESYLLKTCPHAQTTHACMLCREDNEFRCQTPRLVERSWAVCPCAFAAFATVVATASAASWQLALMRADVSVLDDRDRICFAFSQKDVADAQRQNADRLLELGFTEEYDRFQKRVGLKDDKKSQKED